MYLRKYGNILHNGTGTPSRNTNQTEDTKMKWEKVTTMEHLEMNGCSTQGAVLKYGEKVLVCGLTYRGFEAAIYDFIKTEE